MSRGPRLMLAAPAAALLAVALGACPKEQPLVPPDRGDTSSDTLLRTDDLARELELVILDNYLQLEVGNIETYADSIARDREVMLLGIGPEQVFVGQNPVATGVTPDPVDRRPFRERPRCMDGARAAKECVAIVPKRLDLQLYLDDSVGWITDEISYRLPYGGRQAAIPLRITAVFVRDIDLWVMVAEQLSYALPLSDIVALAKAGELAQPARFASWYPPTARNELRLFTRGTRAWLQGVRNQLVHERERERLSDDDKQALVDKKKLIADRALHAFLPDPRAELRERRVYEAEALARLFGPGASVTIDDHRLDVADNKRAAWMMANLTVSIPDGAGAPVRVGLRGLFVYAFDVNGWNLVHSHVSVPVTEEQLRRRVFGIMPEPEPPTYNGDLPREPPAQPGADRGSP